MSEPDLGHLLPDFRGAALLPDAERVIRVRSERWIDHRVARAVLDELQEIVDQPPRGRMLNALLTAEPGVGKTMTLKKLVRENAKIFDRQTGLAPQPVVYVLMPDLPSEEAFFGQVFASLGTPAITYHTAPHRRDTAFRLPRECGTRALVIDEINSVLAGSPRQQRIFLQLLRFLSNELGIALICAGAPEARQAMLTDPQLRSRFLDIEMPPWRDDADLGVFLARLVQSLPLRRPSPVDSPGLRRLIVARSTGLTWSICKAFERAAVAAIVSGEERIDRSSLESSAVWRGLAAPGLAATAFIRRGRATAAAPQHQPG
jgi:Bacterial TniB protein